MTSYAKSIELPSGTMGGESDTYIVAEIGTNHGGELSIAKKQIKAAADAGADGVKFQMFHADEFVSDQSLTYTYKDDKGVEHEISQYEMFKQLELPEDWIPPLITTANKCDVDWFTSVADESCLQTAIDNEVPLIKLASEDLINVELLEAIQEVDIPIILSRGMADEEEIEQALSHLTPETNPNLVLLHCLSCYPAPPEELNLNQIRTLGEKFDCLVGFSDHTKGTSASSIATALGSCVIEKHFTMDPSLPGPDQAMSVTPEVFSELVDNIRKTNELLGDKRIQVADCEMDNRTKFRRGIVAVRNIQSGEEIRESDITYQRPCNHFKPYQKNEIIGKTTNQAIRKGEHIKERHLQ